MQTFQYQEIDSTNLEAKRLIDSHAIAETFNSTAIISAKFQTCGRGRLERKWESFAGNMMFSLVFPKQWVKNSLLAACSCIAVRSAITPNNNIYFKWPNDIVIGHNNTPKKCCGILIEVYQNFYIVGIGINVTHHPELTMYKATNLQQHNMKIQSIEGIFHILRSLLQQNSKIIIKLWNENNYFMGQSVHIGNTQGVFKGVDASFNAILSNNGLQTIVSFGDLIHQL